MRPPPSDRRSRKRVAATGAPTPALYRHRRSPRDGYFEFRATETSSLRLVGLGKSGTGTVATPVKFGFLLKPGGIAEVREKGAYRAETTSASGDVFRITIAGAASSTRRTAPSSTEVPKARRIRCACARPCTRQPSTDHRRRDLHSMVIGRARRALALQQKRKPTTVASSEADDVEQTGGRCGSAR